MGSGDQEKGSSSGVVADWAVTDTTTYVFPPLSFLPSTSITPHPFHALKEKCSLKVDVFNKFRLGFSFLMKLGLVFPGRAKRLVPLPMERFAFTRLLCCVA